MNRASKAWTAIALLGLLAGLGACNRDDPNKLLGEPSGTGKPCPPDTSGATATSGGNGGAGSGTTATGTSSASSGGGVTDAVPSYSEALRTASLKLVGKLPTLDQIEGIRSAPDQATAKTIYESYVDEYMNSPRFAAAMIEMWKNTFRSGNMTTGQTPNRDGAPNFAAKLVVEGLDYRQLFTATSGTCPTFDPMTGAFTPGDCANGPVTAGILSDQGLMFQYASAFAFRRVRFIQETFACRKMPAEWRSDPIPKGAGTYTSPWPFESIGAAVNGGRIDFQDTTAAICANCHTTMNHRAPLFAVFDDNGVYVDPAAAMAFSVVVPIDGNTPAVMSDYLPAGETTAWKFGKPAATLLEFGTQMAADDEVARCAVVRTWNYAFSKGDAVYDLADVPDTVIGPLVDQFKKNGYNLRDIVRAVFVHEDFVRY